MGKRRFMERIYIEMESVISNRMKIDEIREILKTHGVDTSVYGWEIMLYMIFNTYKTNELIIEGFGSNAEIHP